MYTFTELLIVKAPKMREALAHEPAIRPSFARADIGTIVVVMFCLMWNDMGAPAAIYKYLSDRDCQFDRATIDFLLATYEGGQRGQHLWSRESLGTYYPLLDAIPGYDDIPD